MKMRKWLAACSIAALVAMLASTALAMPHRIVDASGNQALGAGSRDGIELVDVDSGAVVDSATGRYTDVALIGENAVALLITSGRVPTVTLSVFRDGLSDRYTIKSHNPPFGGRIDARGSTLYWQADSKVRIFDVSSGSPVAGRTIDTGERAVDVAAIDGGFAILSGAGVSAWSDSGSRLWSAVPRVSASRITTGGDYVVTYGRTAPDDQSASGRMSVTSVFTAADGSVAREIVHRGFEFPASAAVLGEYVYLGLPDYSQPGAVSGRIEVWSIETGSIYTDARLDAAPLDLDVNHAGDAVAASNVGLLVVPASRLVPLSSVPTQDAPALGPFDAFLAANPGVDPSTAATLELVGQLLGFTTVGQYQALSALLQ